MDLLVFNPHVPRQILHSLCQTNCVVLVCLFALVAVRYLLNSFSSFCSWQPWAIFEATFCSRVGSCELLLNQLLAALSYCWNNFLQPWATVETTFLYRYTQCCVSGILSRIPDPTFFHPGSEFLPSRIRIKEFKYFNPEIWSLSSRKYDPGCSSRIRILTFYPSRIPDPGLKKAPDPGSGSATLGIL